jgi:polysaccharide pyruvyl transferase WcaK-like protein
MASIKDVERVADDLERLVGELRSELGNDADFERLIQISDEIAEHADNAAQTFSSVNETLMSRIGELKSGSSGNRRGGQSRQKSSSSSSS